jgi:aerobic carbon-monoxide dehydrogenase medium subunit
MTMLGALRLVQPTTVSEASKALEEYGDHGKIYAGGAELLLLLRQGLLQCDTLIDVKRIERLHRLESNERALRVGACVTHQDLATRSIVRERAPSFAYAEAQVANVRVRNQGTLGGNLCFNDPHSDPGTVLLVHDATVTLGSQRTERQIPLEDFFLDMYATALQPDELLLEVEIPLLPTGMKSAYLRLDRYQRPTLGVAVAARINEGMVEETRLAVGCIGPKSLRLADLEAKIRGVKLGDAKRFLAEQKDYVRGSLRPVDDLLGSADYKVYMACVLLSAALEQAANNNGETKERT